MQEQLYTKSEKKSYKIAKIASNVGAIGGAIATIIGGISGNKPIGDTGYTIMLISTFYRLGNSVTESQFKESNLEKTLKISK
jgi:hypothetical protein